MASTRFLNEQIEYDRQQKINNSISGNRIDKVRNHHINTMLPDFGINACYIPREELNGNSVDVESQIFGIRANDLTRTSFKAINTPIILKHKEFYKRPKTMLPEPFIPLINQRPVIP